MDGGFKREVPPQESKDVKRLRDDEKSQRDKAPDLTPTEQEAPKGPLGAVVKADYQVPPLDADVVGKAEAVQDDDDAKSSKKKKAKPEDLREEIADLQARVATGQATPKQKIRITEAQAELEEATKPS